MLKEMSLRLRKCRDLTRRTFSHVHGALAASAECPGSLRTKTTQGPADASPCFGNALKSASVSCKRKQSREAGVGGRKATQPRIQDRNWHLGLEIINSKQLRLSDNALGRESLSDVDLRSGRVKNRFVSFKPETRKDYLHAPSSEAGAPGSPKP